MLPLLAYYVSFINPELLANTCGLYGYVLELAIKDYFHKPLTISKSGHVDLSIPFNGQLRRLEVKQNGGEFRHYCKGSTIIAYSTFVDMGKPLNEQFGYIMEMSTFKECGFSLKHIRSEKPDGHGGTKMALQSLYNYSKGDFHGAKAFKLSELWESCGAIPFKDFFKD